MFPLPSRAASVKDGASSAPPKACFLCQAASTPFLSCFVIPFFCLTRAASILSSRPHVSIAVARSVGQGRRFFSAAEGLFSLSSGINAIFVVLCHSILLFDLRREHSFVPTACFHRRRAQ